MIEILIAAVLLLQADPCAATTGPIVVPADTNLVLQFTQAGGESVVGADVAIDGGSVQTHAADIVGPCANGRTAWRVSLPFGVSVGSHTAVITSWNYKIPGDTSSTKQPNTGGPVTVAFSAVFQPPPPPAQTVSVSPVQAAPNQSLMITWSCARECGAKDWVGIFPKGTTAPGSDLWWPNVYTNGAASGSYSTAKAPPVVGAYEVRYCKNDGYTCTAGAGFTVAGVPPPPTTKLNCTYALTFTVTTQNNVSTVSAPVITGSCK